MMDNTIENAREAKRLLEIELKAALDRYDSRCPGLPVESISFDPVYTQFADGTKVLMDGSLRITIPI